MVILKHFCNNLREQKTEKKTDELKSRERYSGEQLDGYDVKNDLHKERRRKKFITIQYE